MAVDMAADRLAMRRRIALETLLCLRVNALIPQSIRVSADAIGSRFKIVKFRLYFGLHSHTAYHAAAAVSVAGDPEAGSPAKSPRWSSGCTFRD
jgi:hypothetical protein